MNITPNASYSFTLRIEIPNRVGMLSQVMAAIANSGGDLGAIDIVQASRDKMVRDITVAAGSEQHADEISSNVAAIEDVNINPIHQLKIKNCHSDSNFEFVNEILKNFELRQAHLCL